MLEDKTGEKLRPVTSPEHSLGEVQFKTLQAIHDRMEDGKFIPSYMLDSLLRMHPAAIIAEIGEPIAHPQPDLEDSVEFEPFTAWQKLGHYTTPLAVPYSGDIHLENKAQYPKEFTEGMSSADKMFLAGGMRLGILTRFLGGPIVSQELLDGQEDSITTREAVESWLGYRDLSVLDLTIDSIQLFDSANIQHHLEEKPDELPDPELIVAIPVAIGQEHQTLKKTLELLAKQSLDPEKFEIVLLHNLKLSPYASVEDSDPTSARSRLFPMIRRQIDKETEVILDTLGQIIGRYPQIRVRSLMSVNSAEASIGYIRGQIHKDIAKKYLERGSENNPLIVNLDADATALNQDFLAEMLSTADRTGKPVIIPRLVWRSDDRRLRLSQAQKLLHFERFMSSVYSSVRNTPNYTDCGISVRLKEYCMVGGHQWIKDFHENGELLWMMGNGLNYRGSIGSQAAISQKSVHGSNPRRQVDVMARGHSPTSAWTPKITTFGKPNDKVRTQKLRVAEAVEQTNANLEAWIREIALNYLGDEKSARFLAKVGVIRQGLNILGLPDVFAEELTETQ